MGFFFLSLLACRQFSGGNKSRVCSGAKGGSGAEIPRRCCFICMLPDRGTTTTTRRSSGNISRAGLQSTWTSGSKQDMAYPNSARAFVCGGILSKARISASSTITGQHTTTHAPVPSQLPLVLTHTPRLSTTYNSCWPPPPQSSSRPPRPRRRSAPRCS